MRTRQFAGVALAVVFGLASAILPGDANARGGGGGHGGGARASFGGGSFSGGARASFHGGGGGVRFSAPARQAAAFVGGAPRQAHGVVSGGHHVHHGRRGHRHGGGGYYGYYGSSYAYGYATFISGRSYNSCGWLKARYEDTGLRKWRIRYQECLAGDDD
jgi:hypothetical protein